VAKPGAAKDQVSELRTALMRSRSALLVVAVLSAVLNVLLLAGALYMMLIYDSVLPSNSVPTLIGLLAIVTVVYAFQAAFDAFRSRILLDIATSLDVSLTGRVQNAIGYLSMRGRPTGDGLTPMRDLDHIRNFLSGPGPASFIDLPWVIFFLGILYLLHFWLGVTATVGTIVMVALTLIADRASRSRTERLTNMSGARNQMASSNQRHVELIHALGMQSSIRARWEQLNRSFLGSQQKLATVSGSLGSASRVFRLFLQSAVLSVGALLVIAGEATGGVIFASSILAARALAPIDMTISNWRSFTAARQGWIRLDQLLLMTNPPSQTTLLPPPGESFAVERLALVPPGSQRPVIANVTFSLTAGDSLGIVGPSASGKSSLLKGLIGIWPPAQGNVRVDGAALSQWDAEMLGKHIGYVPQHVELLDGTVAENIARFEVSPDPADVIAAARSANIHDMILQLPEGYDTMIAGDGGVLSAGQRQRVALARALYKNPFLVVLDEPNSNLDAEGEAALNMAIASVRERGGIVIIVAHRPSTLAQINYILFVRDGRAEAFGPRDEVLEKVTKRPMPKLQEQDAL
jgi:ATP-binding cassette subfamily C protein PrsD